MSDKNKKEINSNPIFFSLGANEPLLSSGKVKQPKKKKAGVASIFTKKANGRVPSKTKK
jgi:hypothetical protein